jgi:peptidoglycan hydrolase-like protein with peptidoglycan-binding domain
MVPAFSQAAQAASVLTDGSRGPDVTYAERALQELGYYHGTLDGIYGPELFQAVRTFQATHHLAPDGIVGPETWAALSAVLSHSASASPTFEAAPSGILREGDTGPAVAELQRLLNAHGANIPVDGDFGPATMAALLAFQRAQGLVADGVAGPQTMHALTAAPSAAPASPTASSSWLQLGSRGTAVAVLQRELTALGYNTHGVDGVFGPATQAAVIAFQRAEGLTADGVVGPGTLAALQRAQTTSRSVPSASMGTGLAIAGYAQSLIGTAYRWGGASPSTGFDCSGLVQWVFQHFGIAMPRSSYEQYNVGEHVAYDELAPGDLVFFSTDGPGASHVGIYIGGGEFVSADTYATGVHRNSLGSSYWLSHFIGAVRPPGV